MQVDALKTFFQLISYLLTGKPMDFGDAASLQMGAPASADGKVEKVDYGDFKKGDSRAVDPEVIYAPITRNLSRVRKRNIKYIAIHYTAGHSSATGAAMSVRNLFQGGGRRASADFSVDDGEMVQINPDPLKNVCWAVGDPKDKSGGGATLGNAGNMNSISIEVCSNLKKGANSHATNHTGWYFTQSTLNNAATLTRILMKKYNIPVSNVVRHYDISGKRCPGLVGWNNGSLKNEDGSKTGKKNNSNQWLAFKNSL